jgi:NAD(P)-dependent dehydrogenase (short-subunit alcohol dehydrogenase family)
MLLKNKVAIITGAGRGIGAVVVRRFAEERARMVGSAGGVADELCYRDTLGGLSRKQG